MTQDPNLRGIMVDDLARGRRPLGSLGGVAELAVDDNGNTVLMGPDGFPAMIIPRRAEQFGVVADGVPLYDVSCTNSTTSVITSASGAFNESDVGKVCAIHTRSSTAALAAARYGTITAVQSLTQCTAVFNLTPGALTNAMFVYGTDNATALQAAITAAAATRDKILRLPPGIICLSVGVTVPGGVVLEGAGRSYTEKEWYDFDYAGTSLVGTGYSAGRLLYLGDNTTGPRAYGFNVDGMGIFTIAVDINGRAAHLSDITALKPVGGSANSYALNMGSGAMVDHCTIIGGYNCHPIKTGGDGQLTSCNIYGTGSGYYGIKVSSTGDIIIANNHVWAPGTGLFNAGSVFIEAWQTSLDSHSILITGNQFDTAKNAPHIFIDVLANCITRGINITGNSSFNNNTVSTPYPWLDINVNATGQIRGLMVTSNSINTSWDTDTLGAHSVLIDGAGIAGAHHGSIVTGNYIDRPSVGAYASFSPSVTANNIRVANDGTVTTF